MKKSYRVKTDRDFQCIFNDGTSFANRQFVVYAIDRGRSHFRLGLSVSKKLGNAVTRNTIKRRLRHLVQEFGPNLVHQDIVIIARKGVEDLTYDQMKQNLNHVLKRATLYKEELV